MKILGHELSSNAMAFISGHEEHLNKKWRFDGLPVDYPFWGELNHDDNFYVIFAKANIPGEAFDAVFCHEFYHAFQISKGFPRVIANSTETGDISVYTDRLTCAVLDLSADNAVKEYNIDNSFVVKQRYRQLKDLSRGSFSMCNTPFGKDLLAVDLIIDLHGAASGQKTLILQELKKSLPDVYEMYNYFMDKINEHGFDTPQGCLKIFGDIIDYVNLWEFCHIDYVENQIRSLEQFRNTIKGLEAP